MSGGTVGCLPLFHRQRVSCGLNVDVTAVAVCQFLHLLHHITLGGVQSHTCTTLGCYVKLCRDRGGGEGVRRRRRRSAGA